MTQIHEAKASGSGIKLNITQTQLRAPSQNDNFFGALAKPALPAIKTATLKLLPALGIEVGSVLPKTGVEEIPW